MTGTVELERPATLPASHEGRGHRRASLLTLTGVELRKLADTRAGLWLLIVIALCVVLTHVVMLATEEPRSAANFAELMGFAQIPVSILLPVLGILAMTGEWSQRTALTTFALVPARGRVIAAKLLAAIVIALITTAVTAGTSALANLVAIAVDGDGSWTLQPEALLGFVALEIAYVLMGSAFGALLLNSPLAIVLYFVVPTLWSTLGAMISRLRDVAAWLDMNTTSLPIGNADVTSGEWARFGVSALFWVAVPLVLGTIRIMRREVN
ncbi:ABC transporter permease [Catenuloplanes indicus]|uniref:ABC-type transport system involved in multi-copper enzyme maturation permease subunit n=1 Tax=Catenuloplanes indicus TaxID=137267 RepID=A0AAE3W0V8_9ACTN|nr:ABC transporter permease [Catenuloplanes indicus]MDQ0367286.1 ABC-type transport system involved in multi-copper enzyme maturation permease subunit [Catenuloplanes indicus]